MYHKKCVVCDKNFETNRPLQKCCSLECRIKYRGNYRNIANLTLGKYYHQKRKLRALEIVGKGTVRCSNCGCSDIRILEINHINGSGYKEFLNSKHYKKGKNVNSQIGSRTTYTLLNIINGTRKTDDLNILCHVCNHAHFIKLKYGIDYNIKLI